LLSKVNESRRKTLERILREVVHELSEDRYMLMEYLGPVVDGCRAALGVRVRDASELGKLSEDDFQRYIEAAGDSFRDITICFSPTDSRELFSVVFDADDVRLAEDCTDSNVVVRGDLDTLRTVMDADSKVSPVDLLGTKIDVMADDARDALVGLGLLCFPSLLRMARSGVDPSSLLAEDADAVIMAAASDMVTKLVRRWIDLRIKARGT